MADMRFFKKAGPFTLEEIADFSGAIIASDNSKIAKCKYTDVAPLTDATSKDISFFENKKYLQQFKKTNAGACFVREEFVGFSPDSMVCLVSNNPYKSYALAASMFYPDSVNNVSLISKKAIIDNSATIGQNCTIEAGAVISKYAKIGDNCIIKANAVIGKSVEIGNDCIIGECASITYALIGNKVVIYAGARIGQSGFGFAIDDSGFTTVPQLGRVIIEDRVEIGANTTIDRGAGPDTIIGEGTRIDNLVQIGHNVKIGKNCVIVSQSGISGSTEIGDFVMLGGQSGIAGHLKIGTGARIAAQSGIMRDIPDGAKEYMGSPAVPLRQFMKQIATLAKLAKTKKT